MSALGSGKGRPRQGSQARSGRWDPLSLGTLRIQTAVRWFSVSEFVACDPFSIHPLHEEHGGSQPRADPAAPSPDPFKPFIIFSNRHEIRRIDLHKGDYSVLVPGLRNTIALDFHLSQSALYWTDVVEDKIYRGKLLDNGGDMPGSPPPTLCLIG